MPKTYEALLRAEKDYQKILQVTSPDPAVPVVAMPPKRVETRRGMERYDDLKASFFARLRNGSIRTILFAGTAHGGGTSTTAVNFGAALAKDLRLKVLLVDVNLRTPSLHDVFKMNHTHGVTDFVVSEGHVTSQLTKVGPGNLYAFPCGGRHSEPVSLFDSKRFDQFLGMTRERFDYVILDGPPVPGFSECLILCRKVDGVVLVIEAGKTRRQVALRAKKQLEEAGGKLLGVVINRRKYYIPEWVYKRL
jgi:capsular exopolysaccharide synthesis family protein